MLGGERAQNEVLGSLLTAGIVVVAMSLVGVVLLTQQAHQLEQMEQPSEFETSLDASSLTITHTGGRAIPLADLELVIRKGTTERRYDLGDSGERARAELNDNERFEGGESMSVTHGFVGEVRILLVDTSPGGHVVYDETKTTNSNASAVTPTIETFTISDTSTDTDAAFDVTWNASDRQDDITSVDVELINDETVEATATTPFDGVASTSEHTDTVTNTSGGGEVYQIKLSVTDAAGNVATQRKVAAADSNIGLRSPTIERFSLADNSQGSNVAYEYTYNSSDPDGDLIGVQLELIDDSGSVVDNVTHPYPEVSTTDDQTGTLSDSGGKNKDVYRINLTLTDLEGNEERASITDEADGEADSGWVGSPPVIERFDVTDNSVCDGNSGERSYEIEWHVTDVDDDLATVTLELRQRGNGNGNPDASTSYTGDDLDDSAASRANVILTSEKCNKEYEVRIVAEDESGNTRSESWSPTSR